MPNPFLDSFTSRDVQVCLLGLFLGIFLWLMGRLVKHSVQVLSNRLITPQLEKTYQRLIKPNQGLLGVVAAIVLEEQALIRQVIVESTVDIPGIDSRNTEVNFKEANGGEFWKKQAQVTFFILGAGEVSTEIRRHALPGFFSTVAGAGAIPGTTGDD